MQGLALTTKEAYEVLLVTGWTEIDAVANLTELADLAASDGKQVLVLDRSEIYTLDTASVESPDGINVVARTGGEPGNWIINGEIVVGAFDDSFDLSFN